VPFEVRPATTGGSPVLEIHGELDLVTAPELERAVEAALAAAPAMLVVDLTPTTFLDSSGARQVARAARSAFRAGAAARVVCPKDNRTVRLVIDMLEMQSLVPVLESTDEVALDTGP
jgi:anti-sigma B factor antagonist